MGGPDVATIGAGCQHPSSQPTARLISDGFRLPWPSPATVTSVTRCPCLFSTAANPSAAFGMPLPASSSPTSINTSAGVKRAGRRERASRATAGASGTDGEPRMKRSNRQPPAWSSKRRRTRIARRLLSEQPSSARCDGAKDGQPSCASARGTTESRKDSAKPPSSRRKCCRRSSLSAFTSQLSAVQLNDAGSWPTPTMAHLRMCEASSSVSAS